MTANDAETLPSDLYRIIVESAAEGIWTIDQESITTFVNAAMADMLGYERAEMLGHSMYDFMDEAAKIEARTNMSRRRAGLRERHAFRLMHKQGHTLWTSMVASPLYDPAGSFVGALAFVSDETSRLNAAEEQRLREQEVVRLDKMISLSALVAGVIHEINNPNHFITLNASLLKRVFHDMLAALEQRPLPPELTLAGLPYEEMRIETPRMLEQILSGADRIRHIVSELRAYVNTDAPGPLRALALNDVVASAVTLLEGRIRRTTDHFSQSLAADLPPVEGDAPRLVQAVVNVLLNALEALTDRSQRVDLATRYVPEEQCVELTVRDQGPGISPEIAERIRTPFFSTKRARGGLGLGLAVAERILSEHRAELVLASSPSDGTQARLRLPVAK